MDLWGCGVSPGSPWGRRFTAEQRHQLVTFRARIFQREDELKQGTAKNDLSTEKNIRACSQAFTVLNNFLPTGRQDNSTTPNRICKMSRKISNRGQSEIQGVAQEGAISRTNEPSTEISHLEHVLSEDKDHGKDHMNYDRVDKEVAQYASNTALTVSPEDNRRLKKMIDRRVLLIMIFTYFLQALDKGTMSFASIMNIQNDTHLHGQQVSHHTNSCYPLLYSIVCVVDYLHLYCCAMR